MQQVYLDNAATTKISDTALKIMVQTAQEDFANPSSIHNFGQKARHTLEESHKILADSINAAADEIVITSGGSEADNMAIMQTALARKKQGRHIITTTIEHEAVLHPLAALEKRGFDVTYLSVDQAGVINLADLRAALRSDTILVTIMTGNNQIGSCMPIHDIGQIVHESSNAWFHTDAVQAYGLKPIDVKVDQIDLLSVSAHKLNGPKFMGFLYLNHQIATQFPSLIRGGSQEHNHRAGTENVPAIAGFAAAVTALTQKEKNQRQTRYYYFKQKIIAGLTEQKIQFSVNGGMSSDNLQHVLSLWIKDIPTYLLLGRLNQAGIAISAGSACTATSQEPSHVLIAMYGSDSSRLHETIRVSFGKDNTIAEIDYFITQLSRIIYTIKGQ